MGIVVEFPLGLRSSPRFDSWRDHARHDYLVFVDESFRGFFHTKRWTTGYFCYAAVGVPEANYADLCEVAAPIFDEYRESTRLNPAEFKHEDFHQLPYPSP